MSTGDYHDNPARGVEQGLLEMKRGLGRAMTRLSDLRTGADRARAGSVNQKRLADEHETKARRALEAMQAGRMAKEEAEALALDALEKKEACLAESQRLAGEAEGMTDRLRKLETDVVDIKAELKSLESEMLLVKAGGRAAEKARDAAKAMAEVDTFELDSRLDKLRAKVEEDEALAEAWGQIADGRSDLDRKIDAALNPPVDPAESLARMKKDMKLGS